MFLMIVNKEIMRKLSITLLLAFIVSFTVIGQSKWKADKAHSTLGFKVTHMIVSEVSGQFNNYDVNVTKKGERWEGAQVEITIKAESIDTDNKKRDKHLRSEEFLHVKEHPKIKFKSTSFEQVGENKYEMEGELTLRGKTNKETFTVIHTGTIKDPYGNQRAGFQVKGKINRFDYNVKWNKTMDSGNAVVGENVKVDVNMEILKKKE